MAAYKSSVHGLGPRSIEGHDIEEGGGASLWSTLQLGAAESGASSGLSAGDRLLLPTLGGLYVLGGDVHLSPLHCFFDAGQGAVTGADDKRPAAGSGSDQRSAAWKR